jgi:hypothetical protein
VSREIIAPVGLRVSPSIVGREADLIELEASLAAARAGHGRVVRIEV